MVLPPMSRGAGPQARWGKINGGMVCWRPHSLLHFRRQHVYLIRMGDISISHRFRDIFLISISHRKILDIAIYIAF